MRAGHGSLIIHGDGLLFIMVVGIMIPITDGYGFRIMNGAQDGLPGEAPKIITDGHR